ncbi:putative cyclin-F2-1 [Aegilops tauschii subsp. strangulata]|uniref:putative cyclin-F2-1 n=1 Tax=Aegilops tauschii subsp. strangulata TaxID=200361 RepID=UPI003CC84DE9
MMQYAVDPYAGAFARPPPTGFFGVGSCAWVANRPARRPPPPAFFGIGSCFRPTADVPARRPPPPGFFGARRPRVLPVPAPCEVPMPPKFSKPTAPAPAPVSCVAAASIKLQRLCPDYEDDIDHNLRLTEKNAEERPLPDYLTKVQQDRVSESARASLVGWMDKFVRDHDLADGTLHHAVAYVDRVLSVRALTTDSGYELRLLGAAAIFVAANYEDRKAVWKLKADQIARYGEFAAGKEVLDMEREMVEALGYQLGGPTAHTFLSHFMRYAEGEDKTKILPLATRLVDQSLLNYTCLRILPSLVAASAISLARRTLNPPDVLAWNRELTELTGYNCSDMTACVLNMFFFSRSLICNPSS